MPPKSKKGKGKTVDINTFNEDVVHEDVLDWADDDWNQSKEDKVAAKIAKHREFSRTENNVFGEQESFRTAERLQPGMLGSDLQPPYVAHFGNIRNGTDDEAFLKLFDEGVVVAHHLINQDGKTFALVEFTTADAMRLALLLDGTFQRGRKLYVDLATPKQVERLFQHTGRSTGNSHGGRNSTSGVGQGFSRDSAGQPQPGAPRANSFADLTRDSFGAQQQSTSSPLLGERASPLVLERSTFGSKMDLHSLDELSRDVLGSAVQPAAASRGGAPSPPRPQAGSPTTALASWRDEEPLPQRRAPRDGDNSSSGKSADASASGNNNNSDAPSQRPPRRREYGSGGFMGGGGNRGGGSAAPSFGGGNWRDEPRAPAPVARRERDDHGGRRGDANNNDDNNSKPDDAAATPTSRDAAPARRGERPAAGARASRQGAAEAPSADNWASLRR